MRLFGVPNLLKRLQAKEILSALDLHPGHRALDFGCGSGYMTVEMSKLASEAIGIDVNPYVATIRIPPSLANRLRFQQATGLRLPFPDHHFDRILASEVLPMIPEPTPFLAEIKRVLKPNGKLIVVNGTGLPAIKEAYASNSPRLMALRQVHGANFPPSYDDYCAVFQKVAGTGRNSFLTEPEILDFLATSGFMPEIIYHSPRKIAGDAVAWRQFELFLQAGKLVTDNRFLVPFFYLGLRSLFDRRDYLGGLIVVAISAQ